MEKRERERELCVHEEMRERGKERKGERERENKKEATETIDVKTEKNNI